MTRREIERLKQQREEKLRSAQLEQQRREREWQDVVREIASYENIVRHRRQGGKRDRP